MSNSGLVRAALVAGIVVSASSAVAQTGVRITLPLDAVPSTVDSTMRRPVTDSNFLTVTAPCAVTDPECTFLFSEFVKPVWWFPIQNLDWGGGNIIYNASHVTRPTGFLLAITGRQTTYGLTMAHVLYPYADASRAILHVTGFVNNVSDSFVHGQVMYTYHAKRVGQRVRPMSLVLQRQVGLVWQDVTSTPIQPCDVDVDAQCANVVVGVEAYVPGNSNVRLELRNQDADAIDLDVLEASLFGAECFPDFSSPDLMCIKQ